MVQQGVELCLQSQSDGRHAPRSSLQPARVVPHAVQRTKDGKWQMRACSRLQPPPDLFQYARPRFLHEFEGWWCPWRSNAASLRLDPSSSAGWWAGWECIPAWHMWLPRVGERQNGERKMWCVRKGPCRALGFDADERIRRQPGSLLHALRLRIFHQFWSPR